MEHQYFQAAVRLHNYIITNHWNEKVLIGPDPGFRINYRIGRFLKNYLSSLPWNDDRYYVQAQGYWILGNCCLFGRTGEERYRDIALHCAEYLLQQQREDGGWNYPSPEWKGRTATVEGVWGSLGLLEIYRQTANPLFLTGARRWHKFLVEKIGFQRNGNELIVNYLNDGERTRVPNNSALVLRFLAELYEVTGDKTYLQPCAGLLTFLQHAQRETGEFPYVIEERTGVQDWVHFQCYQYNAFQCLDLIRYQELTKDMEVLPLITSVLRFLGGGLTEGGRALYACGNRYREVTYHTAVLAAAFTKATQLGIDGYYTLANRAYSYLLHLQRPSGSFPHSQRDYRILSDQRSYPRYLAMILYHLLLHDSVMNTTITGKEEMHAHVH